MFTSTPKAYKPSSECSRRTVQRRNSLLKDIIVGSSATSAPEQTGLLISSYSKKEKKTVRQVANMEVDHISPEEMLALKAKLGIPWEKLKTIGRYKHCSLSSISILLFQSSIM